MSAGNRLVRAMFVYGLGEALTRFLSLLLLPLFTSYLSPADYGILSILGVIAMIATPVFSLGLGASLGVSYFEPAADPDRHHAATIWTAFTLLAASCSLLAVLAIGFSATLSSLAFGSADQAVPVALLIVSTCLTILRTPFMLRLQFDGRARTFAGVSLVSSIATIGLSLLFVVVRHRGVLGMVQGWVIANAVILVLTVALSAPGLRVIVERAMARELLRLGIPLIPSFASLFVLQQANKSILQHMRGLEAVGIYTIGLNLGMVAALAVSGFSYAWHPFFLSYSDRQDEARVLFGRVLTFYVLGFGAIGLAFFVAARAVVVVMTQPAFYDAYRVVGLAATSQILIGVFSILLAGMYFAREVKYQSIIQAVAAAIAVGANVIAIRLWGIFGAALALVIGYVAMVVLQQLWNRRRGYLAIRYEWGRVLKFAVVYVAMAALTLWPRSLPPPAELALAVTGLCAIPGIVYLFLREDERRDLGRRIRDLVARRPWARAAPPSSGTE
ncbi:MAG: oligosaccharide flippase family protein [Gemmatimonadales bacterium]|nr:oligosaccharide flippase family protein [Gemmatimonadales bacterium]